MPARSSGRPAAKEEGFAARHRFSRQVYRRLCKEFGPARTPLTYEHDYQLAIAVILSAQCTDEMVNRVTPALFEAFGAPEDFYTRPVGELERLIYSTGFYKNKAKSIRGFCRAFVEDHGRQMPSSIEELVRLPGIGRKTANVIQQELFGRADGVVVDTHVARISKVLGLSAATDPVRMERDLMRVVPKDLWLDWSLYIIFLGRKYCTARERKCGPCPLCKICPSSEAQSPLKKEARRKKTK